ncbi:MAG: hypothetical protein ISS56_03650 [Anaerolineae bacterium]|nr:hypothetical protein [Anaerolineae bacterium]
MDQEHIHDDTAPSGGPACFCTLVTSGQEERFARLLIESLRAFGGPLSRSPVWVFHLGEPSPDPFPGGEGVRLVPLDIEGGSHFWFAPKVHACAQAEGMAGSDFRSLVWLASDCLILNPPLLFDLAWPGDASFGAAFRTVHHANIGSRAQDPLDEFWSAVYGAVGLDEAPFAIESFVDRQQIRPYWNTHCFSIDPARGLLGAWRERFVAMVTDRAFQAGPCRDEHHRVFLHQAVLSALVSKELDRDQVRMLPPEYSYPLHMHAQVPPARRARALNDLVCAVHEYSLPVEDIGVREPLRTWLSDRLSVEHGEADSE